ncbi:unnamed protein product [Ceratitis capitata]|uniref:(Mediterranean fruit fly) hypothetical protein n=1 Tax=Ceratitis capitata TaxID=7213 RepID=A0A811UE75_CERCA|nr:unnamed protein product [Ceratitis capitata]
MSSMMSVDSQKNAQQQQQHASRLDGVAATTVEAAQLSIANNQLSANLAAAAAAAAAAQHQLNLLRPNDALARQEQQAQDENMWRPWLSGQVFVIKNILQLAVE